ncbi:MAG: hypothetical protein KatS3mg056_3407 [Chloroflexus sp.]|nr:MAG: hypothetical protein KatS3mg056_3407 [Chloroflexus sp.]
MLPLTLIPAPLLASPRWGEETFPRPQRGRAGVGVYLHHSRGVVTGVLRNVTAHLNPGPPSGLPPLGGGIVR